MNNEVYAVYHQLDFPVFEQKQGQKRGRCAQDEIGLQWNGNRRLK